MFASSVAVAAFEGQLFAAEAFSFRHHLREAYVVSIFSNAVAVVAAAAFAVTIAVVEDSGWLGQVHQEQRLLKSGYLERQQSLEHSVAHY